MVDNLIHGGNLGQLSFRALPPRKNSRELTVGPGRRIILCIEVPPTDMGTFPTSLLGTFPTHLCGNAGTADLPPLPCTIGKLTVYGNCISK